MTSNSLYCSAASLSQLYGIIPQSCAVQNDIIVKPVRQRLTFPDWLGNYFCIEASASRAILSARPIKRLRACCHMPADMDNSFFPIGLS